MHAFHPQCLKRVVELSISKCLFPVQWPVWYKDMLDRELQVICDQDSYEEYLSLKYKKTLTDDNSKFLYCPTPNCGTTMDTEISRKTPRFDCPKCKKIYCAYCRENWHNGLSWKEYRSRKGYPQDDCTFFKFIKGEKVKKWSSWQDWIDKPKCCPNLKCLWSNVICKKCNNDCLVSINSNTKHIKWITKNQKQPIHSYSAKPAYNSKYYKYVGLYWWHTYLGIF